MTSVSSQVLESEQIDATNYTKALLNILDDFNIDRELQDSNNNAILNIFDDITDEKIQLEETQRAILNVLDDFDAERKIAEKSNADLVVVNESMRNFIGIASHDLRSPLASIMGFASVLAEKWTSYSEEDREFSVAAIFRQSQKLSSLVDDLFTLSSIESGGLSASPEPISLGLAIENCLDFGNLDRKSISVSCSEELLVLVDPNHLGRILDNYIQNAFKYGAPPVHVKAVLVNNFVQIRVMDSGAGVPPEFISKLFSKFARAQTSKTKSTKGAGLGLSIVRGLAEVNGGSTSYEQNFPNGSCFVVSLPALKRSIS